MSIILKIIEDKLNAHGLENLDRIIALSTQLKGADFKKLPFNIDPEHYTQKAEQELKSLSRYAKVDVDINNIDNRLKPFVSTTKTGNYNIILPNGTKRSSVSNSEFHRFLRTADYNKYEELIDIINRIKEIGFKGKGNDLSTYKIQIGGTSITILEFLGNDTLQIIINHYYSSSMLPLLKLNQLDQLVNEIDISELLCDKVDMISYKLKPVEHGYMHTFKVGNDEISVGPGINSSKELYKTIMNKINEIEPAEPSFDHDL